MEEKKRDQKNVSNQCKYQKNEKKTKQKNVDKKVQSNGEAHLFVEKVPMQSETMESILWIQVIQFLQDF